MSIEPVRPTGVVGNNPNVQPAGRAWGEPATSTANIQYSSNPNVQPAGLFSMADYVDPSISRKKKMLEQQNGARHQCSANGGTCKGFASPETGLCGGHMRAAAKARGEKLT